MTASPTATDRYAVIGQPIAHSRSPMIHHLFARQTGQAITYEAIEAPPEGFETAVRGFGAAGGKGLNITVPHKQAAYAICNTHGPEAQRAQAVNTISIAADGSLRGDNTDGRGFIRDLTVNLQQPVADRRVLILGAGGAARGILAPLLDAEPETLVIANRTTERAEQLIADFSWSERTRALTFAALEHERPFDVVINATSIGLQGEAPPFPACCVGPDSFCYDLAYSLQDTPFVVWAQSLHAMEAVQGWGMLVEQAAESFEIWRGVRPETAPILEHMRR